MKVDRSLYKDIIEAYTIDLWPLREIADVIHVSRTAIYKILKKHGVDTSKSRVIVACTACGNDISRTRKRVRKQRNHFCTTDCYYAYLDAGENNYTGHRSSQRTARRIVSERFKLKDQYVVHHEDRNCFNNHLSNLKVFACNGDHIKYHHAKRDVYHNKLTSDHRKMWNRYHQTIEVKPLWEG